MSHEGEDLGRDLGPAEAAEDAEAYRRGWALLERHVTLEDRPPAPSRKREAEVREGIRLLQRAVTLQPRSWPAHWMVGKGYQALDEHRGAYEAFRRAAEVGGEHADVRRELCLECLHLGRFGEAVEAARVAVRLKGSDLGLRANLTLALLLAGDVEEAHEQAGQPVALSPRDEISREIANSTKEVRGGRRPQPKSPADLESDS